MPGGWSMHMGYTKQVVPMGEDRRKTWWMLAQLGRRLGLDVLEGIDIDTATDDDVLQKFAAAGRQPRITSYNVCYTKLLRYLWLRVGDEVVTTLARFDGVRFTVS